MTGEFRHLRLERDGRGVATVPLDVQGSPMNVFNEEVFRELEEVIARLERDPPRAVVFRSTKPTGFLAGADVRRIQQLKTEAEVLVVLAAPPETFDAEVNRFIDDLLAGRQPVRRAKRGLGGTLLDGTRAGRAVVFAVARRQVRKRAAHYPALPAALRAVEAGFRGP